MSWLASGPVGLIIGAVVALGVGVYMLIRHWDTVRQWLTAFWQKWGDWIAGALAVFMPFIGIPLLIVQHWDTISTFFAGLWRTVSTGVVAFVGNMRDRFIETRDRITEAWAALTERFTEIGNAIRDSIVSGFESARDTVMTVWQTLIDWFQAALEPITRIIDGTVGKVQDVVGRARDIGGGIRDRVSGIFGGEDAPRNRDHGAFSSPTTATAETRSYSERVQRNEVWLRADRGTSMSQTRGGLVEQSLMLGVQ